MPTQLELFPEPTREYPRTDMISIPFEWWPIEDLLNLPSIDFPESDNALAHEVYRQIKRNDRNYDALKDDIRRHGFINPVTVRPAVSSPWGVDYPQRLGNGHHRIVAAFDLGYRYVPVTDDEDHEWDEDGISSR